MGIFWEGLASLRLPCTLALVVPVVALIVAAGRNATLTVTGFFIGSAVAVWARFIGVLPGRPLGTGLAGAAPAFIRLVDHAVTRGAGLGVGLALAMAMVLGVYDDLVAGLVRATLGP